MAKRRPRKWWDPLPQKVEPPDYLRTIKMTGAGVPERLSDRAFWLGNETGELDPWIDVFEAIDKQGDNGPLMALLKSDHDLSHYARVYLADLISRYEFKRRPVRQNTPAYDRTPADVALTLAKEKVNDLVKSGKSNKSALEQVSKSHGIPLEILAAHCRGSLGSFNRKAKRRP